MTLQAHHSAPVCARNGCRLAGVEVFDDDLGRADIEDAVAGRWILFASGCELIALTDFVELAPRPPR